jgi:CPA1 family monovalent cation:H+ antiporter
VSETFAHVELFVMLLAAMLGLTALARRLLIPYPILLVLGGLALAFIPGVPSLALEPDLVFVVFLPPILWAAAYFTSLREFRRNLRAIGLLAIGLVLITTLAVGWVAHAIIPGINWAAALCLGAIVSPPDAVAATAVLSRIGVPRTVITVLEGESLVNDASALVLYRAAVAAMVSGVFSLGATAGSFVVVAAVGVLVGLAVGWLTRWAVRHMPEGYGQVALTLLAPYVAWVVAERLHASAVLACVAGGIYVRQHFSVEVSPLVRIQARSVWDLVIFLLNGIIFILIGLQLGPLRRTLAPGSIGNVLTWGILITLAATVVRMLWMPLGARLVRLDRAYRERNPLPPARYLVMVGWTAMRGVVSLATALALPLALADGTPLPYRAEIILVTFVVILATLVVQGLSLAPLARWLGLSADDGSFQQEQRLAREHAAQAAIERLDQVSHEEWVPPSLASQVRGHYERRLQRFHPDAVLDPSCSVEQADAQRRLRHEALVAERHALVGLRNRGEISDEVLHDLERELDVEALRQGVGHLVLGAPPAPA